jgi:hypothetical protein
MGYGGKGVRGVKVSGASFMYVVACWKLVRVFGLGLTVFLDEGLRVCFFDGAFRCSALLYYYAQVLSAL